MRSRGPSRIWRASHRIAWLLKSLFLNLTPGRRVLLALALLLLCVRAQWRGDGQSLQIDFGGLPVALLLLLLMLELKDKLVARSELQAGRAVQQALLPKEAPQNRFATLVYLELAPGSSRIRLGAVEAFVGEARWHDDVSLVIMRRAG